MNNVRDFIELERKIQQGNSTTLLHAIRANYIYIGQALQHFSSLHNRSMSIINRKTHIGIRSVFPPFQLIRKYCIFLSLRLVKNLCKKLNNFTLSLGVNLLQQLSSKFDFGVEKSYLLHLLDRQTTRARSFQERKERTWWATSTGRLITKSVVPFRFIACIANNFDKSSPMINVVIRGRYTAKDKN